MNECFLDFLCSLFTSQDAYEGNQHIFKSSREEWNQTQVLALELVMLGHVLFPRNREGVDVRLLQFQE